MSHHHLPRIHFRGEFSANVPTANNDDIAVAFPDQQFVDVANVKLNTFGMSDPDFATWLRQIAPPFGIRGGWNLYGNGYCRTPNSTVQSVHTQRDGLSTDAGVDSFVGATVNFTQGAVMVDLDPEGTRSTQIISDEIRLSKDADKRIVAGPLRFYSRDISRGSIRRNLKAGGFASAAANWYAAVPAAQCSIQPGNSPILAELEQARMAGQGLFFAFCTYFLKPNVSQTQLAADFASGLTTKNPAIGRWIGTIGIWHPAEMGSVVPGRRLFPGAELQHDHQQFALNVTAATVQSDRKQVTVDLLNTCPEVDETLEKALFGELRLGAVTTDGGTEQLTDLGQVAYDRAAYEVQSGLIDVDYTAEQQAAIDNGHLVLYLKDTGTKVLSERRWSAYSDDRCVYMQDGEVKQFSIRLFEWGKAPSSSVAIGIAQYETTNRVESPVAPSAGVVKHAEVINSGAGGEVTFQVTACRPGVCLLAVLPPDEDPQSRSYFVSIRVLPKDDYTAIPDSALTFSFIYAEVLRHYHLLYPAMSERFALNKESLVRAVAHEIKRRVSTDLWPNVAYMPITRDLSDGKRKLLQRWCDLVMGEDDERAGRRPPRDEFV